MVLIDELRRRNVFRVAVAYIAAAWLITQVAETVFPLYGFDTTPARIVVTVLAVGFPLVLILAWLYELTPEGLKLERNADRSQSVTPRTGRKLDRGIIVVLTLAVGYFAVDKFVLAPERSLPTQETGSAALAQSIAVLPFAVMSSGPDDEYFADGLTEEILNSLAQLSDLRVTGRTSSFYYKDKGQDLRVIGEELGVGNILEGSVRRAGDQLRITAQLIKADDGFHIWSKTYDRSLDDIFAIQEDIANEVTGALKATLLGNDGGTAERIGTSNPEAQSKFLIALGHARLSRDQWIDPTQRMEHAVAIRNLLDEAVAIDPEFGEAWALLAMTYHALVGWGIPDGSGEMLTVDEARELAGPASERAIELAPESPYAWLARANHLITTGAGIELAEETRKRALALDPDNVDVLWAMANAREIARDFPAAIEFIDRILAIDPLSQVRYDRARFVYWAGNPLEARRDYLELARTYPDAPYKSGIAEIEFDRGHLHHGLAWVAHEEGNVQSTYAWASLGDLDRAVEAMGFYKAAGGAVADVTRAIEPFFARDYEQFRKIGSDPGIVEIASTRLVLPPLYYLRRWQDALSFVDAVQQGEFDSFVVMQVDAGPDDGPFFHSFVGQTGSRLVYYAHALACAGRDEEADAAWNRTLELAERFQLTTPRLIQQRHQLRLLVFASRGDTGAALDELEAMIDAGWRWLFSAGVFDPKVYSVDLGWFEDSPLLDSIRNEPRFKAALERVKADNARMLGELNAGLEMEDIRDEDLR